MGKKLPKDSIEKALVRLAEIVDKLERGTVTLDEALDLFEEGVQISKECNQKLKAAELRVQKLVKTLEGEFQMKEFKTSDEPSEEEF